MNINAMWGPTRIGDKASSVFNNAHSIRLVAAGILLTLVAIVGREYLPQRTVNLIDPGFEGKHFLYLANDSAGGGKVRWIDEKQFHFRCHYPDADSYQPCALTFMLTPPGVSHGVDLRSYRSITLDLSYRGNADTIRLAIRTFDPRFSRSNDGNSSRMQSINLRARDINGPITIDLGELTVPEWWIAQFNLPREYNLPNFDNATALTIDLPGKLSGPPHEVELRGLQIHGEWLSREALYLGILCVWMLCALGTVTWWLVELRRQHRRQKGEIEALVERTAQLRVEQDHLRRQATIDPLTGVLNRRGIEQSIADAGEQGLGTGLAIVMVDIDHFKRVNDAHGHDVGDQVLRRVAAVMAQNVRANDILGRWGGEEFMVACVNCSAEHAAVVAQKIRQRIEASAFGARPRVHVTASFGVAVTHTVGEFAECLQRADAALYHAKSHGRNRVVIDGELVVESTAGVA